MKTDVTITLRISDKRLAEIKKQAQEMGISQNACINTLIFLGFKTLKSVDNLQCFLEENTQFEH